MKTHRVKKFEDLVDLLPLHSPEPVVGEQNNRTSVSTTAYRVGSRTQTNDVVALLHSLHLHGELTR